MNPVLELKKKISEWQKQIQEAAEQEKVFKKELLQRIYNLEERVLELEQFRNHMEGFDEAEG